jgi:hypothetical protein
MKDTPKSPEGDNVLIVIFRDIATRAQVQTKPNQMNDKKANAQP